MKHIIRKRLRAAAQRSERAANSQAVSPPPASGSPFTRSAEQAPESPPGGGCDAFPAAGGEGGPETPPPGSQEPRQQPITPEDAPLAVEGAEALQGLFAVDRQPRPPSLAEALAGGPPTAEQIDAAVERATHPRRQEILPLPPVVFARLCPGCRSLDGEHDFGPTCTLDPEPEETPAAHLPWVEDQLPSEIVLGKSSEGDGKALALPAAPLGPADVRRHFLDGRAPSTRAAYASDLAHFARWRGLELDEALADFLGNGGGQAHATALGWLQAMTVAKLAPATVARRLASLRSFVELAGQLGLVNWALLLKAPKVEAFRDTRGPGVDGVRKLLQHCGDGLEGVRNRALILVVFSLGLRRSELAKLRLKDYDRAGSRLAVQGKGKAGQLVWMSLPREIATELDAWLCAARQIACEGEGPLVQLDDEPLFHSLERREQLSGEGIRYILGVIGKRAGVKVRPHGLRHAAVTAVLEETKGNIQSAQRFSRHADPKTVLKYDDNRQDLGGESAKLIARRVLEEE